MYENSPLQKNALIFGNVFPVAGYVRLILQALLHNVRTIHICSMLYFMYIFCMCIGISVHRLNVTVKTFPKFGAFFCKGLPAYMHIVLYHCLFSASYNATLNKQ